MLSVCQFRKLTKRKVKNVRTILVAN